MRKHLFPIVLLLMLFCTSCENHSLKESVISTGDKQVLFFSDENNVDHEGVYYDALIQLKSDFPSEMKNFKVLSKNEQVLLNSFNIKETPALLIIEKNQVTVSIEGKATKDYIFQSVSNALSHDL